MPIPEHEIRKPVSALSDTYAAAKRGHDSKLELWRWECELIRKHNQEHKTDFVLPPEPLHPFQEKKIEPMTMDQASSVVSFLAAIPALLGLETRPTPDSSAALADSLVRLSRHYPLVDDKRLDQAMVAGAAIAWSAPLAGEVIARRKGAWTELRAEYQRRGLVAPDGGSGGPQA